MKVLRRIWQLLRWRKAERELSEELEFHRAMKESEYRAAGLGEREARLRAARDLGNMTAAQERARAVWLAPWVESLWQDARYGVRALRRQPSFTLVAVGALALGIGLNTSVFTVWNAIALRPWPVRNADRLVSLYRQKEIRTAWGNHIGWPVVEARYLRAEAHTLSGVVADRDETVSLGAGPDAKRAVAHFVSGDYFQVLGVDMALGRPFAPDEDTVGAARAVAVLSYRVWQSRYGADPSILEKGIRIDDQPFAVVGVAAESFAGTSADRYDLWVPLSAMALVPSQKEQAKGLLISANDCCAMVTAVLAPAVTREQAEAELTVLDDQFARQHGRRGNGVLVTGTTPLANPGVKRKLVPAFVLMFAGVALVLLLACANVANLLIARAAARQREIAVRLALGAGRARVVRQLMTEGFLLAAIAALLGLVMAHVLPGVVFRAASESPPASLRTEPDLTVLGYACAIAALSTLVFALLPALHGTRASIHDGLKQRGWLPRGRFRLRAVLLAAQVAISVVLLVACGLTTRGVERARSKDLRFTPGPVVVAEVDLPASGYDRPASGRFMKGVLEDVEQAPGIASAALTATVPLGSGRSATSARTPAQKPHESARVLTHSVSAGYFDVLGVPLVSGRTFAAADGSRKSVLVNQTLAERWWPQQSPLGQLLVVGEGQAHEVIGVVRDAHTTDIDQIEPTIYLPFAAGRAALLARGPDIQQAAAVLRAAAQRREGRATSSTYPLAENVHHRLRSARTAAGMAAALGLLALALASVGVFGVVAYAVEQRTREIGVRMALGATRRQIVQFILTANTRSVLAGLAIGLVASLLVSRLLESRLYGVSRLDPVAYGAVLLLLALAAVAATFVPARRATRIDPMNALRCE